MEDESLYTQLRALPGQGHVNSVTTVTVSADGAHIFTTGDDNTAKRWLVATGQVLNQYLGHTDSVWCLGLASSGRFVLTGSRDALAKRWDVESGACEQDYAGHEGEDPGVRCLALVPGDETFFTGSRDFTVRQWDVGSGRSLRTLRHEGIVWNLCASPDGQSVFSGSADTLVKQWRVSDGEEMGQFKHPDFVWSVAVSPDNRYLYTGCRDKLARRWDIGSGEEVLQYTGHTDTVRWVSVSSDGLRVVTAGYDVLVKEWDADSGRCLQDISAHEKAVLCVTTSPVDGQIFSSSADALVMRFLPAPASASSGPGDPEKGASSRAILTEVPITTYTNISGVKIGLVLLAIVVQALQIASFAFSSRFPWAVSVGWLTTFLGWVNLSLSVIFEAAPSLSLRTIETATVVWAYVVVALFFSDAFGHLQAAKAELNRRGWGKVKRSRYKGDNPLEKGERTAENKAEWEVWETVTWIYWCTDKLSQLVWGAQWLGSTLLAIPTVGILVETLFRRDDTGSLAAAGIALALFVVVFLRLRVANGSASAVSFARKRYAADNRDRLIPGAWLFTVGGIAAVDTLGPLTMADWQAELGATSVQLGFSVVNASTVTIAIIAAVNVLFAALLVANLWRNSAYYSLKASRALFALQALQIWNSTIALCVVVLDDPSNIGPGVAWYVGVLPVLFGSMYAYTRVYAYKNKGAAESGKLDAAIQPAQT